MASTADFVNYICEQLEGLGAVRSRKMFGEYMVYLNDKPVLILCDDQAMVKMLPCLEELLQNRPTQPPYQGGPYTTNPAQPPYQGQGPQFYQGQGSSYPQQPPVQRPRDEGENNGPELK